MYEALILLLAHFFVIIAIPKPKPQLHLVHTPNGLAIAAFIEMSDVSKAKPFEISTCANSERLIGTVAALYPNCVLVTHIQQKVSNILLRGSPVIPNHRLHLYEAISTEEKCVSRQSIEILVDGVAARYERWRR